MKFVTSAQVVQGVGEVDSGGRSGEWPDGSLGMSYQGSGSGDGGPGAVEEQAHHLHRPVLAAAVLAVPDGPGASDLGHLNGCGEVHPSGAQAALRVRRTRCP